MNVINTFCISLIFKCVQKQNHLFPYVTMKRTKLIYFFFKHLDCCNEQKILHTLFSLSLHALFLFCVLSNAKEQSCRSRLTSVFCWPSGGIKVNKTVITIADSDLLSMKK